MYYDLVLMQRTEEAEELGKKLGFGELFFVEDIKTLRMVDGKNQLINREAVENKHTQILLNPHQGEVKDTLQYRNAGLNQVVCNLAHENEVAVAFSLDAIQDAVSMGRVMQNIVLCRKYKVKILFFSRAKALYEMRGVQDLLSLCRVLGMTPGEAKQALTGLGKLFSQEQG